MSNPPTILPHTESDMPIPPTPAIIARASELADQAWRQQDNDTYRQLVNLIDALKRGIKMTWSLGDLLVTSASQPGVVYTVSCGCCSCPAWKPCKHLKLFEVLVDMLDTEAGDADLEADCDEPAARAWRIGLVIRQALDQAEQRVARQISVARAACMQAAA